MRTSILCEFNKLRRSKILFVALFGIVMILVIVAAQGFYAGGDTVYGMEPEWFLTGVQSLGTMYAIPGIIALFGCYVFCREMQEDKMCIRDRCNPLPSIGITRFLQYYEIVRLPAIYLKSSVFSCDFILFFEKRQVLPS